MAILQTIQANVIQQDAIALRDFAIENATPDDVLFAELQEKYDDVTFYLRVDAIKFMNVVEFQFRIFFEDVAAIYCVVDTDNFDDFLYALGAFKS